MKYTKKFAALLMAVAAAVTMSGCANQFKEETGDGENGIISGIPEVTPPSTEAPPEIDEEETPPADSNPPSEEPPVEETPPAPEVPQTKTVVYVSVTGSGVNLRSGPGTNYKSVGTAQYDTRYAYLGKSGDWYKIYNLNKTAYVSAKYSKLVEMESSGNDTIEAVIAEGTKLLGAPYVFGAARYHYGNGTLLSSFDSTKYDCSSLMQYIYKIGADVNLQMTTRTQIYQGTTVPLKELKRGDLMFFTNSTRKDNVGIERVGHVALYLGGNWILHTASDYAKIEQISATRWSYYIQSQRVL